MTNTMTSREANYFKWLCDFVYDESYGHYSKLLEQLYLTTYKWKRNFDKNRAIDGLNLRITYIKETGDDPDIFENDCSVLEMMVALALRCEETIMKDDEEGNRTGQWFWSMIVSLQLGSMTDDNFSSAFTRVVLRRFMDGNFEQNGTGGLFTVYNPNVDMRNLDIWYQMHAFLNDSNSNTITE